MSITTERTGEEAPHLGEAFHAARKGYGLASALLVAWELIGIEFGASPVDSFDVTLKSPQAVPYVLVALILYFAFRLTVEWYQASERRRSMAASRADYIVAHLIGAVALLLYAYQALRKVQVANFVDPVAFILFALGFASGHVLYRMYRDMLTRRAIIRLSLADVLLLLVILMHLALVFGIWIAVRSGTTFEFIMGLAFGVGTHWLVSAYNQRRKELGRE